MSLFGDRLFLLRRRRRLLQKQVALEAGLDPSYLGGMERGRREPPAGKVFERIARALNASESERAWLHQALAVSRLERLVTQGPFAIEGGEVLVKLAEQLPALETQEVQLLEAFVQLLAKAARKEEPAM